MNDNYQESLLSIPYRSLKLSLVSDNDFHNTYISLSFNGKIKISDNILFFTNAHKLRIQDKDNV